MIDKSFRSLNIDFSWKSLLFLIKMIALGGIFWLITTRIINGEYTFEISTLFKNKLQGSQRIFPALVLLFMLVNWYLESLKWKLLIKHFTNRSIWDALQHVCSGISLGILTPNRVGEYGGRIMHLDAEDRIEGIQAHFVSSLSQNIVNLGIGALASYIYLDLTYGMHQFISMSLMVIIMTFVALLFFLYRNHLFVIRKIAHLLVRYFKNLHLTINSLKDISIEQLNVALGISFIRYIIFTSQYVLLLYFYGIELSVLEAYAGVGLIYVLQSGIPIPASLSMLARGEVAIIVWGVFTQNILPILAATFTLWLINLILPALMGTLVILKKS